MDFNIGYYVINFLKRNIVIGTTGTFILALSFYLLCKNKKTKSNSNEIINCITLNDIEIISKNISNQEIKDDSETMTHAYDPEHEDYVFIELPKSESPKI